MASHMPLSAPSNQDEELFSQLDPHTHLLRQTAAQFAALMSQIEDISPEQALVIKALTQVHHCKINQLDDALNNFKKAYSYLSFRQPDGIFGPHVTVDQYPEFIDAYNKFLVEINHVTEKAFELNSQARGNHV